MPRNYSENPEKLSMKDMYELFRPLFGTLAASLIVLAIHNQLQLFPDTNLDDLVIGLGLVVMNCLALVHIIQNGHILVEYFAQQNIEAEVRADEILRKRKEEQENDDSNREP